MVASSVRKERFRTAQERALMRRGGLFRGVGEAGAEAEEEEIARATARREIAHCLLPIEYHWRVSDAFHFFGNCNCTEPIESCLVIGRSSIAASTGPGGLGIPGLASWYPPGCQRLPSLARRPSRNLASSGKDNCWHFECESPGMYYSVPPYKPSRCLEMANLLQAHSEEHRRPRIRQWYPGFK